jgi:hypothetical protein
MKIVKFTCNKPMEEIIRGEWFEYYQRYAITTCGGDEII